MMFKKQSAPGGVTTMLALDQGIAATTVKSGFAANEGRYGTQSSDGRRLRRRSRLLRQAPGRTGGWVVTSW